MGLFRDAGKRLERFKRQVEDVAASEAEFECRDCGTPVYADREDCPECGGSIVAREPKPTNDDETSDGDGTDSSAAPSDADGSSSE
jgi:rRNA maturation endonuclease Nob1